MRDIFEPIASDPAADPTESARRNMRALRRRFYTAAGVREVAGGFEVALDDRPIRTPARHPLVFPTRGLAEAAAAEWNAQGEYIEPAQMPLTRLANTIIDGVAAATDAVAAEVAKYLGSDLLFYRATGPERLVARQHELWDPVLAWARDALGARFLTGTGVMPLMQPEAGAGRRARGDPARALAARRRPCGDDAHRLGLAGAGARPRRHHLRGGVDRGECRRGLEHRAVGRRYARARAPRAALRGDGGGGAGAGGGGGGVGPAHGSGPKKGCRNRRFIC